ncbi:hypothetical protein CROQUDRAFT_133851 [Cronartium quercuum f. sp. fusiforme G11]|uniref:F-box domain-containing protein n=1 Tax=Cronartium quercuum f. sp. fusiforme G11 TaxID=708437 RepID=A0A9P6TAH4_9BASI|nr:hypothetical protein CROQUDRAFT_133851 [Cronartium quercuum f. sp. fusiforme G11]
MSPPPNKRPTSRTLKKCSNKSINKLSISNLPIDILVQIIEYVSSNVSFENIQLASIRLTRATIVSPGLGQIPYINFLHNHTPILNGLQALGSVNKLFYELCRPRLWSHIHLPSQYSIPIDWYLNHILSKHGPLVKNLSFNLSPDCCLGPKPSTRHQSAKHIYDNTTKTRLPPASGDHGPVTVAHMAQRGREPLSAQSATRLVVLCPNLQSLTLHLPPIEIDRHAGRAKYNLQTVLLSLVPHLTGLEHLAIDQTGPLPMPDQCMSKVIRQLPLLRSLSLSNLVSSPQNRDSDSFGWALSRLQHLNQLHLFFVNSAHKSWCDYPWPKSIQELRLERCGVLSPIDTYQLIQSMAPNVIRLALGYGFDSEVERGFEHRFDLPELSELTLDVRAPPELTICFKNCHQLRRLKYNRPTMADWDILNELVPSSTWPNLRHIDLRRGPIEFRASESFKEFCIEAGIELLLKGSPKPTGSDWDWWDEEEEEEEGETIGIAELDHAFENEDFQVDGIDDDDDDDILPYSAAMLVFLYLYLEEAGGDV